MATPIVNVGDRFGIITVTKVERHGSKQSCEWVCDCIPDVTHKLPASLLIQRKSCGCAWHQKGNPNKRTNTRHGHTSSYSGIGRYSRSSYEHTIWTAIKQRCFNPNNAQYKFYGARGISMCSEWVNSFEVFLSYLNDTMGGRPSENHTFDRINSLGNYEPGNVRWATMAEQQRNRRNNVKITIRGVTMTIHEWSRMSSVAFSTIYRRVEEYGWNSEDAVFTPTTPPGKRLRNINPVEAGTHAVDPPHHSMAKFQPRIPCTSGMKPAI